MALEENILTYTYLTEAGDSDGIAEFLAVAISTTNPRSVKLPAAQGDAVIGIIKHSADGPARAVTVIAQGIARCIAGAAISTPGLPLMATTAGKLIPATTGKYAIGYAVQAAANNDQFEAHITGPWQVN